MDEGFFENFYIRNFEKEKGKHQFENLSRKIIGTAIEVHKELGPGFLENIYEELIFILLSYGPISRQLA